MPSVALAVCWVAVFRAIRAEFVTLSGVASVNASAHGTPLQVDVTHTDLAATQKVVVRGEVSVGDLYLYAVPDFALADFPRDACDGAAKISDLPGLAGLLQNATSVRGFSVLLEISALRTFLGLLRYRRVGNFFVDNSVISVHNTARPCAATLDFWHTEISAAEISDPLRLELPDPVVTWEQPGLSLIGNLQQKFPARHCLLVRAWGATRLSVQESEISSPSDFALAAFSDSDSVHVSGQTAGDRKFTFEISDSVLLAVGLFRLPQTCALYRSICGQVVSAVNGSGLIGLELQITAWTGSNFRVTDKISDHRGRFCVVAPRQGRLSLQTGHSEFFPFADSWLIGNIGDHLTVRLRGLGQAVFETHDFRSPPVNSQQDAAVLVDRSVELRPPETLQSGTCRIGNLANSDFRSTGGFALALFPAGKFPAHGLSRAQLWLRSSGIFEEAAFVTRASERAEDANVVGLIWRGLGLRLSWPGDDRRSLQIAGSVKDVSLALRELVRVRDEEDDEEGRLPVIDVLFETTEGDRHARCQTSSVLG